MLINAIFLDLIGGYGNLGSHLKKKLKVKVNNVVKVKRK